MNEEDCMRNVYSGALDGNGKDRTATVDNTGISLSIKQKKPSSKDYILYGSSYPECNKTGPISLS